MVEMALISGVIPRPSRTDGALALFHNIAIIAQSFWVAHGTGRHAGARLLDRRRLLLIDDVWREWK